MLQNIIENIGLNPKEARIYLAALEIGSSPVSKIASKAKLNRVTAYDILEKLVKKGMISHFTKDKIKYFTAADPEIVVEEFKKRTEDLKKVLPDLKRLHGDTIHPRVRYYEGLEGIKSIYADTLKSKTEILNYGNSQEIRKHWPTYDEEYVKKRAAQQIYLRGIAIDDEDGRLVKARDGENHREIRLINKEKFDFSNEINIYDDKLSIISFKDELIGMIIESPEIANTQRAIFKMVWEFCSSASPSAFLTASTAPQITVRKVGTIRKGSDKKPETAQESQQIILFE
jgi:HTH-type transcriptional regulator, sugar sensing transcriptional regulator